ncbi:hypothetical protein ABW20_dc0102465 [Dactylellina cionopaga]|nr:hypothetical protein ABW20_dc0102465 [Dactylellina cionopaga]
MASLKDRSRKAKTVFSLDSPTPTFLHPSWPDIASQTGVAVFAALTRFLTDLQVLQASSSSDDRPHFLLGPNPVTAYLEHLASLSVPVSLKKPNSISPPQSPKKPIRKPLAIFVTRPDQPSQLHSHLPFLCSISSIPLIALPKGSEQKLVGVLKPSNGRVYMLAAFEETPGAEELRTALSDKEGNLVVGKVEIPSVFKTADVGWLDTKSKAVQTFVGEPRRKKRKEGDDEDVNQGAGKGAAKDKTPKKAKKGTGD